MQDSNASNESAVKSSNELTRIMIIINKQNKLGATLSFLGRRGYEITVVHTIADTIKNLLIVRPKVILISWNLRQVDVKKIHSLITAKFKILCIVFAEENSKKTATALMNSGFPHTILPPVSGPTIHMRIQNLLRKKNEIGTSKSKSESLNAGKIDKDPDSLEEVTREEMSSDTVWSKTENSQNLPAEQTTWRGLSSKSNKVYYFRGPDMPTYDSTKEEWDVNGKTGPIFSQTLNLPPPMPVPQESNQEEESFSSDEAELDWEGEIEAVQTELGDLENEFDTLEDLPEEDPEKDTDTHLEEDVYTAPVLAEEDFQEVPKKREKGAQHSILAQSVKASVEQSFGPIINESISLGKVTQIKCLVIESNQFKGYLIFVTSNDDTSAKKILSLGERVSAKMKHYGSPLKPLKQIIEFTLNPTDFMDWSRRGDFQFLAQNENSDAGICFISVPQFPHLIDHQNPDVLGVSLETDLIPGEALLFDLYLHMPKNDKFILYLSKNTVLQLKTIQKLLKFGVKIVYIKSTESSLFFTYSARYHVQRKIS